MSIKVTHVVRQYLPSIGGMEEVVRNIALHQIRNSKQQAASAHHHTQPFVSKPTTGITQT